jgi:hypothetical protein
LHRLPRSTPMPASIPCSRYADCSFGVHHGCLSRSHGVEEPDNI